ncbi:zinc ABC transporter substrate-binding protein [Anaerobacillus sp. CMMVII]|uniref:metal ABC transporter solute-binding protein, Zn/Mn family n=1 Tax=Anaerobacillus sp. CMMVII TaxID=2755588 RepID=UPI0021B7E3E1|nr:zinc ABC transporter substrate-binding protein [Anaerobacillus sp. CMMVII]MCT8139706.1 zinc ABC transporter substrate-binding protein [Anaerobacillus sp. CMMVII]
MLKQKIYKYFLLIVTAMFVVVGCGGTDDNEEANQSVEGLSIVTSFSILDDIIGEIIGDRGTTSYIVPIGEEPHEYEPLNSDFQKVSNADVFIVNGLDLEEWLTKIVGQVTNTPVFEASQGIEPIPLVGSTDEYDPHAWLSVVNVIQYVNNIVGKLSELDPEGSSLYKENGGRYIEELQQLHEWIETEVANIPIENRVIVVSENAFKYFGAEYGFITEGIWDINSHEEGTTGQISRIIDIVRDGNVPALFIETTVDPRYINQIATETGVDVAGTVFTDAIGKTDDTNSYIKMMKANVTTFVNGLKSP